MTPREQAIRRAVQQCGHGLGCARGCVTIADAMVLLDVITRYRTALERCAEGALVVVERGTLVNIAKRALENE